jgi:hypothetical protein
VKATRAWRAGDFFGKETGFVGDAQEHGHAA